MKQNNIFRITIFSFVVLIAFAVQQQASAQTDLSLAELQRQFVTPPDDSRIMMRWWWFGPAVTKSQIERELKLMKEGGIGGVEIQPVYPVALDDEKNRSLPFLSNEFIEALKFTNEKARELGMRIDLTIGSGWPFGGPSVPITEAAGRLRVERIKLSDNTHRIVIPAIIEGEKLIAVFLVNAQNLTNRREITAPIKDSALMLPADLSGANEIQFYISGRTGQQVKRAAVGAEGFVLNHYDRGAVGNYLKNVGDRLLQAFGNRPPYAIFCDSLEVYLSDWTPDFLEEFQKRRGYDLKPYLPALIGDIGSNTASIRHDWGVTLTELLNDRFLKPVHEWAARNHTKFRIQGYGIPPMTLSGNALADLPEGEGPQWKVVRASRWASSASHLYGRNITSSETWTWLHSPSFRATPLDVKAEADLHFLQGINQLIGHGWPYTAEGAEYPGWRFYAAAVFNEKNPWWIVMPDLSRYLQRVSFLMRQGQPANDIALYLPNHDAWSGFSNGKAQMIEALRDHLGNDLLPAILESGFNLDFIDDEAIKNIGRVENKTLALGANKYRAVVIPNTEYLPLETLRRLEEFANNGGVVIATKRLPSTAPGFKATDAEQQQIRVIIQKLFEGESAKAFFIKDEKAELGKKLASLVQPDLSLSPAVPEIGFIRRHTNNAEIYFLANSSNKQQNIQATFRVKEMNAEIWNPFDGSTVATEAQANPNGVTIPLELAPYESRVIIFTKRTLPKTQAKNNSSLPAPIDLSVDWQVTINNQKIAMNRLSSWSENESTRYFSGVATYEKTVNVPENWLQPGLTVKLDLGEGQAIPERRLANGVMAWIDAPVRDAAIVYINDQRAGSVWLPPFNVDVTKFLKRGENRVKIMVGNTAINYLSGRKLPDYKLLNLRYGDRFQPQDMQNLQPLPSGLLGPIRLIGK